MEGCDGGIGRGDVGRCWEGVRYFVAGIRAVDVAAMLVAGERDVVERRGTQGAAVDTRTLAPSFPALALPEGPFPFPFQDPDPCPFPSPSASTSSVAWAS